MWRLKPAVVHDVEGLVTDDGGVHGAIVLVHDQAGEEGMSWHGGYGSRRRTISTGVPSPGL